MRFLLLGMLSVLISACGFQLRGVAKLPFETMYVEASDTSPVGNDLRAAFKSSNVRITNSAPEAQAVVQLLGETREKIILSLSGGGRVREYQLRMRVSFRVYGPNNKEFLAPTEIVLLRDLSYDDTQILAKESEEALLFRDIQNDAVQQIMRRVSAINP